MVARFLIDVDGLETEYPGRAEGLLPAAVEGVRTARMAKEAVGTLKNPEGTPVKIAFDSVYAVIETALATHRNLSLLPLDTLRGHVPYLLGYPMGNPANVTQWGPFEGALALEVDVDIPNLVTGSYSILGTGKAKAKGHPEMTVKLRLTDADGNPLWKARTRVRSKQKVVLDEKWVLGLRTRQHVPDAMDTLPDLTRQAMAKLLKKSV